MVSSGSSIMYGEDGWGISADWSNPVNAEYQAQLVARAVDLVQLFPAAAYAKNGADIRLAVDAVEDMFRLPDLTHVVIVAGDSDYVPLAQRCTCNGQLAVALGLLARGLEEADLEAVALLRRAEAHSAYAEQEDGGEEHFAYRTEIHLRLFRAERDPGGVERGRDDAERSERAISIADQ